MRKAVVLFLSTFTFLILAVNAGAAGEKEFVNYPYLFAMQYDSDKIKKVITDDPPRPNHGVLLELISGGSINVTGNHGHIEIDYNYFENNCISRKINTKHFKKYYECNGVAVAFSKRKFGNYDFIYTASYSNIKNFSSDIELFKSILRSFIMLPDDADKNIEE